ncbi:MAG TPA: neutral zinc metallopeptidase [Vicinamibacterales bacterium]|nr:neutral zinc metallopeptidase [Vicinamibacterales bacterium]
MRWSAGDRSNIEDLRGRSGGGGGRMVPLGIGGFIVVALLSMFTGVDFFSMLGGGDSSQPDSSAVGTTGNAPPAKTTPAEERMVDMVDAVARDAQQTWSQNLGSRYQPTRVVLFRDSIQSACGYAGAATGPFYCPGDRKVYLDLGFFDELQRRFGAAGDFAQAYVLAHEIGHHIQTITGTEGQLRQMQRSDPGSANALSVRLELQADCYAGVWGHDASASGRAAAGKVELDPGDLEEALGAAAAIGDDRLQKLGTGRVMPEKFTHGSSEQRVTWFKRGFDSGDPRACDTFGR